MTTSSTLQRHVRRWARSLSQRWGKSSTCGGTAAANFFRDGSDSTTAPAITTTTIASKTTVAASQSSSSAAAAATRFPRPPMRPFPQTPRRTVPAHIPRPPYARNGVVPSLEHPDGVYLHTDSVARMRDAARLARQMLDLACAVASPGTTTDEVDGIVHQALVDAGAYPSPLNYGGFPKSICSSVNEVICHGIPDTRPLEMGDVVSFDVSCFYNGVHGDNCATIIVGDESSSQVDDNDNDVERDWRGVPVKTDFDNPAEEAHFVKARRLVRATRESLYAAIDTCRAGSCLTEVGHAIEDVADAYGYQSVRKYRGHGISHEFHCPPFVKHFRNDDQLVLQPGMIFTIEPMLVTGRQDCVEWPDEWTVLTRDGSLAAQFEHTILVTETGSEILTLP